MRVGRLAFSWAMLTACGLAAMGCGDDSSSGGRTGCNPFTGVCTGTGGTSGSGGYGTGGTSGYGTGGYATGGYGGGTTYDCTPIGSLSSGATISGELATTDSTGNPRGTTYYTDRYMFQGTAGTTVTITITTCTFDTYMYLMDASCAEITHDDDGGTYSLASAITYTLPTTGTYTVFITSFSSLTTGTYTLTFN
jgi:trimeric autotransporter adhesin